MTDISVPDAQYDELEAIREELEAAYVGEYGTVRTTDALQYLLDTYTPPTENGDGNGEGDASADIEALTAIEGVGEATAESLVAAGFGTVADVAAAPPEALTEIKGIGDEQAVDIVAGAAEIDVEGEDDARSSDSDTDDDGGSEPDSPERTLQQAMSLLDAHDERWRESSGDEPYEVDLPDGSSEAVRTKDDVKRLLFKHWK